MENANEWWIVQNRKGQRFVALVENGARVYFLGDSSGYSMLKCSELEYTFIRPLDISPGSDDAVRKEAK